MKHGRKFGSPLPGSLADPNKRHLLEGEWRLSASDKRIDSHNPATSCVLAMLPRGKREDGDAAIA
jgi:aldehyde dehydrogenase (NAD+)